MGKETIEVMMTELLKGNPGELVQMEKIFNNLSDEELKRISWDKEKADLPAMRKEIKRVMDKLKKIVQHSKG